MKYLFLLLLTLNAFALDFTKDDLSIVKANFKSGKAVIIDTRSQREWNKGHVNGAKRYEVSDLKKLREKGELEKNIPKDKIIYTHCMAGYRAKRAAEILKERGYDVRPLKKGYPDLIKAGFPKK
ncbi:MAG: rhodanese-like domain-containing protein [Deltaproteobacteria bacterium]|nr:MAG: rhodanese-like domain-containing protein [Deltaproteobacteria bacterium]